MLSTNRAREFRRTEHFEQMLASSRIETDDPPETPAAQLDMPTPPPAPPTVDDEPDVRAARAAFEGAHAVAIEAEKLYAGDQSSRRWEAVTKARTACTQAEVLLGAARAVASTRLDVARSTKVAELRARYDAAVGRVGLDGLQSEVEPLAVRACRLDAECDALGAALQSITRERQNAYAQLSQIAGELRAISATVPEMPPPVTEGSVLQPVQWAMHEARAARAERVEGGLEGPVDLRGLRVVNPAGARLIPRWKAWFASVTRSAARNGG